MRYTTAVTLAYIQAELIAKLYCSVPYVFTAMIDDMLLEQLTHYVHVNPPFSLPVHMAIPPSLPSLPPPRLVYLLPKAMQ